MPEIQDSYLRQFKWLEAQREEINAMIRALPPEVYHQSPRAGKWSMGQIANHLYWSEKRSLDYLRKKLSYPDTVPGYHQKSWLGLLLTRVVFLTGYKIKAPEGIDMWKITEVMSPETLIEKWDLLRKEMFRFVRDQEPSFGRHLAFRHPFAGRMTMYQMLLFFGYHCRHHMRQMKRILLLYGS